MKRKMLISIALITIMLLNCMMPLLVVNANMSGGEEIQLNSKLYKAIKSSLYQEGIVFESDDITHTITISPEEKAKVKKLNLNESAIFDITGIEAFSAVEHLELSGNNLSKESNLAVLNSLTALNYLDLSTNQLDDVSDISELISKLQKNGTVILSGQTVTQVNSVFIDSEEESDQVATASFELPGILELAGYLKSVWKEEKRYSQRINPTESSLLTPYIEKAPMYVKSDDNLIEITIADKDTGIGYYGMVKFTIYIYDDATEAAQANNPNRASENILNGSRFYLYYVIHDSSSEAITTMDTNLYRAIKEQLTGGQTVNSDLTSYPYVVNKDGDMVYEEFTYTTEEIGRDTYKVLTNIKTGEIQYAINSENGDIYSYNGTGMPSFINTHYETIEIKSVDENGNVSIKEGYKVAFKGDETGETLYVAAYDDAKTFVINDLVLTNKITSLILNNRQIRDLSGIEKFIGLNSELNVSHNYLSDIDPIYSLQEHKDYWEAQMIETFTHWLKTRQYGNLSKSTSAVNTAKKGVEDQIKNIEKTKNLIFNILVDAGTLESSAEDYESQIKSKIDTINGYLDTIYGYTAESGEHVDGYLDIIDKHLNDAETGLNKELNSMYSYLGILYDLYNNKYKLTTFLADDVNYMTYEEYEAYKNDQQTEIVTTGSIIENIYVQEEITYKAVNIPVEEKIYTSSKDLSAYLLYGDKFEEKKVKVKTGDSIESLAFENQISVQEFLIFNSQYTSRDNLLVTGTDVTISTVDPKIKIVVESYEVVDKETDFEIIEQHDKNLTQGSIVVAQQGENGLERVSQNVKSVNGEISYVDPEGKEVLKSSIPKIINIGTKYVPNVGSTASWGWPTNSGYTFSSYYGYRLQLFGEGNFHSGIDIAGTGYGSNVYAANNGTIVTMEYVYNYGYHIIINHNNGYYTVYAHMKGFAPNLSVGSTVSRGQIIGYVGDTGWATGPHLHYEIRTCARYACTTNPLNYYR